jgi:predicted  nucleic acid-binding Zn-ribbon protein
LFCGVGLADAQTDAEIKSVEAELQRIQQEQQSLYQQFQMIQELRRTEMQTDAPPATQNPPDYSVANPPPNYDDLVRDKAKREDRIKQYTDELYRKDARYRELEDRKRLLLDRLNQLGQQR